MHARRTLQTRLGLSIPHEWWPSAPVLAEIEAAGFAWAQLPAPRLGALRPAQRIRHARAAAAPSRSTRLRPILHFPSGVLLGEPAADRALEGAISYAAECGAEVVVYHARAIEDRRPRTEDRLLAEARSLAALAPTAERLGVAIALENLAPCSPGPRPSRRTRSRSGRWPGGSPPRRSGSASTSATPT